jgi:hypothetical protein
MFQIDYWFNGFGGGGAGKFCPAAPDAPSVLPTTGMFGPSGG